MAIAEKQNKWLRFRSLSGSEKALLMRAVCALAIARLTLLVTSFQRLSANAAAETSIADGETLGKVGAAVLMAANNVPWRSDCLPQALAASRLLRAMGYDSTIRIGVEKEEDGSIGGHAWLTCGEHIVVGATEAERFAEVHAFSR